MHQERFTATTAIRLSGVAQVERKHNNNDQEKTGNSLLEGKRQWQFSPLPINEEISEQHDPISLKNAIRVH